MNTESAHLRGPCLEEAEGRAHGGAAAGGAHMGCIAGGHQDAQPLHKDHHSEAQLQQSRQLSKRSGGLFIKR